MKIRRACALFSDLCSIHFLGMMAYACFFATSCKSKDAIPPVQAVQEDTVANYTLKTPGNVDAAEANRIQFEAEKWYADYIAGNPYAGGFLLAKDGKVLYEKYVGSIDPISGEQVNANHAFHIASVSKTFTAMLVLKLAEQGKLELDDLFSNYFPAFNYDSVTVRTLLNHRSGLPNYLYFMEDLWLDKTKWVTNADVLDYLIRYKQTLPPTYKADTHFSYCNTNYVLLALLIEKVTGKNYAAYLNKEIVRPLQLSNTFLFSIPDSNKVIKSYTYRNEIIPYTFLDGTYGDKNIFSTPQDLLKWARLLDGNQFLNSVSLTAAYTPYSNERPGTKNYGLGWRMLLYPNDDKIIFHNGWWHGNTSTFMRLPKYGVTIIALNNRLNRVAYKSKILANIFYPYFTVDADDEDGQAASDSASNTILADSSLKKSTKK